MSYTLAALLGVVVAAGVDLLLLRTRLLTRRVFWVSYAIVLFFQLVVNGLLTGLRIVRYDPRVILGWRVVHAPVEDLLFGFAMVLMTLSGWVWCGRCAGRSTTRAGHPARPPHGAPARPGSGS